MDFSSLLDFLENFETGKIFQALQELKIGDLIHNPWFLAAIAIVAILSIIMRWRVLLAVVLSLTGAVALINYTVEKETRVQGIGDETLLVFIGGFACITVLVIYLLFIKGE